MGISARKVERRAIIIGGGMAGLLAARVLSEYCTQVTLIERDAYPAESGFRSGVPQGRQAHILLSKGQEILEALFPGFLQRLEDHGAVRGDFLRDTLFRSPAGWLKREASFTNMACTRMLLEWQVHQDIVTMTDVQIIEGYDVIALRFDQTKNAVSGVQMRKRGIDALTNENAVQELSADLVIDASGRESKIIEWLREAGYPVPEETVMNPFLGYATRFYRPTVDPERDWRTLIINNNPPTMLRSGSIWSVEGGTWQVVLSGMAKDYPPTDNEGFLAFMQELLDPTLYETLKDAEPLTPVYGYRRTENRWRHFERLKNQPEGLIVIGDAFCVFDPYYGQGMTMAAVGAMTIKNCLARQSVDTIQGLSRRIQRRLARVNQGPWQLAVGADFRVLPPEEQPTNLVTRLTAPYLEKLMAIMPLSTFITQALLDVANLKKPPTSLFHPFIVWKVLTTRIPA